MAFVEKRVGQRGVKWDARWHTYKDGKRKERCKTFGTQKDAKKFLETIGVRKASSNDPLKTLTDSFLDDFDSAVKKKDREESTLRQYRQHINLHILTDAEFSALKCGDIGTPEAQAFLNRLYTRVSPAMTVKVKNTLSQIFSFGSRNNFCSLNPVRETKIKTKTRPEAGEAGETFVLPPKADLKRLLAASCAFDNTGQAEAIVRVWMYAGLRASEMRGLPVHGLSLDSQQPKLRVNQRADRWNKIDSVKSKMSRRDVPLGADTVKAIKRWLEARPEGDSVFPTEAGNVQSYPNLYNRFWVPLMNRAGLVTDEPASKTVTRDVEGKGRAISPRMKAALQARKEGKPITPRMKAALEAAEVRRAYKQPRFSPHTLRHVYASLQIEQGIQPKRLQVLMGHSTLKLTMDLYGHLWPNAEADEHAANVEKVLA